MSNFDYPISKEWTYPTNKGWVCPKCGAVYSPSVLICYNCSPQKANIITTQNTNEKEPKE